MILSLMIVSCASKKTVDDSVQSTEDQAQEVANDVQEEVSEAVTSDTEEVANSDSAATFTCTTGSDERKVEVVKANASECEVYYTKNGNKTRIAHAKYGAQYCSEVANRVKTNLEGAGFTCQM